MEHLKIKKNDSKVKIITIYLIFFIIYQNISLNNKNFNIQYQFLYDDFGSSYFYT